jgi:hypothetical protein
MRVTQTILEMIKQNNTCYEWEINTCLSEYCSGRQKEDNKKETRNYAGMESEMSDDTDTGKWDE